MPSDWKLTDTGDKDCSSGDWQLVSDTQELVQTLETKILKLFNEDVYALGSGVPWLEYMLTYLATDEARVVYIRRVLLSLPEITKIIWLDVVTSFVEDSDTGLPRQVAQISFELDSIYGPINRVNA